jgi:GntR family transcriptional regulator
MTARAESSVGADRRRGRAAVSDTTPTGHADPRSSPALLSHRVSFTTAGSPVIDDYALLPADSVAITVNRSPGHLEVHYTLAG